MGSLERPKMTKQDVLEIVHQIPGDEVDPEELMHALYLRAKLDQSEAEILRGDTISQEEMVRRTQQWFK